MLINSFLNLKQATKKDIHHTTISKNQYQFIWKHNIAVTDLSILLLSQIKQ